MYHDLQEKRGWEWKYGIHFIIIYFIYLSLVFFVFALIEIICFETVCLFAI